MVLKYALFTLALMSCTGSPCTRERSLKRLARESVTDHLKAPTTASFGNERITEGSEGLNVWGEVTSQNAFGAMMTEDYWVHVKCLDGIPVVTRASMEGGDWGTEHEASMEEHARRLDSIRTYHDRIMDSLLNK